MPQNITRGVVIHIDKADANYEIDSKLLDTDLEPPDSLADVALADGAVFFDEINGIKIIQLNHNDQRVNFAVTFIPPTPTNTTTPPNPPFNNALEINNEIGGYIEIPYQSYLSLDQNFTIETWIKINNKDDINVIVSQNYQAGEPAIYPPFLFGVDRRQPMIILRDTEQRPYYLYAKALLTVGKWYHLTVIKKQTTITFFIDGRTTPNIIGPENLIQSTEPIAIGFNKYNAVVNYYFNGQIDELRISNTARYDKQFTVPPKPLKNDASTLALYHFDEENGSLNVTDSSNYQNNGFVQETVNFVLSTIPRSYQMFLPIIKK